MVQSSLGDRLVNLNDSTTFECTFFGNPVPSISWRSVANNGHVSSLVDKEKSEITSRLILTNISWYDQGPIECHAKSPWSYHEIFVRMRRLVISWYDQGPIECHAKSLLGEDFGSGNLSTLCKYTKPTKGLI